MTPDLVEVDGVPRWFLRVIFLLMSRHCRKFGLHDQITHAIKVGDLDTTEAFRNRVACGYCGLIIWKKPTP